MSVTTCTSVPSSFPSHYHIQVVNPNLHEEIRVMIPQATATAASGTGSDLMATTNFSSSDLSSSWEILSIGGPISNGGMAVQFQQSPPADGGSDAKCIGCPASGNLVPASLPDCCTIDVYCASSGGYNLHTPYGQIFANVTDTAPNGILFVSNTTNNTTNNTALVDGETFNFSPW